MSGNSLISAVTLVGALALSAPAANAMVTTTGCAAMNVSCTLAELAGGGGVQVDNTLFSNWSLIDASTLPVDPAQIIVTPLNDRPLDPGLRYTTANGLTTSGFDLIDLALGFTVSTTDGSARIKDNLLELTGFSFGAANAGGFISFVENIRNGFGISLGDKVVFADNLSGVMNLFDSALFTPQPLLGIQTSIILGGDSNADTVSLTSFEQRFSQIPEPSSLLLVSLGLLGLWRGLPRNRPTEPTSWAVRSLRMKLFI